jgi:hypothetical protein
MRALTLLAGCVLFACGGDKSATRSDDSEERPDGSDSPESGRVFMENQTPYVVEVAFVDSFTSRDPGIIRSLVGVGERRDISAGPLPAATEVEFDLAFQIPAEEQYRIRRKATVRIDGETVVLVRLESADDPFSLRVETHAADDRA